MLVLEGALIIETIVFGLLKREGNVYTEIIPDCSKATLQGIIRGHIELDSVINTIDSVW